MYEQFLQAAQHIFFLIGLAASGYKTYHVVLNINTFTWGEITRLSERIITNMKKDMYVPDVIVGVGRGGAVLGAMLSGNAYVPNKAHNIPIIVIDRIYQWQGGQRIEVKNKMIDLTPLAGKKVLLVAGDVSSGDTMKYYIAELSSLGVEEIKTAALVKSVTSTYQPTYWGREIAGQFRMPWMYRGKNYIRDSRGPST